VLHGRTSRFFTRPAQLSRHGKGITRLSSRRIKVRIPLLTTSTITGRHPTKKVQQTRLHMFGWVHRTAVESTVGFPTNPSYFCVRPQKKCLLTSTGLNQPWRHADNLDSGIRNTRQQNRCHRMSRHEQGTKPGAPSTQ